MRRPGPDAGTAAFGLLGLLTGVLVVALVVVVDLGAYLLAAHRAQAAADAGALAAATAAHPDHPGDPTVRAREAILGTDAVLVRCDCPRGARSTVEVTVRHPVGGLVVPRVWASTVDATAHATTIRVVATDVQF